MSTPADTFTDRTDATDEEFRARVAVFDAAEEPEEIVVERMARAMWEDVGGYVSGVPWERAGAWNQAKYRHLATAAMRTPR